MAYSQKVNCWTLYISVYKKDLIYAKRSIDWTALLYLLRSGIVTLEIDECHTSCWLVVQFGCFDSLSLQSKCTNLRNLMTHLHHFQLFLESKCACVSGELSELQVWKVNRLSFYRLVVNAITHKFDMEQKVRISYVKYETLNNSYLILVSFVIVLRLDLRLVVQRYVRISPAILPGYLWRIFS